MAAAPAPLPAADHLVEPRRPGRPRKTDTGSARRSELIQIAARSFRQKGFAATTTRDIAAASGMQSGSPFYHFKSKNALLHAVMQEGMELALQGQKRALARLPHSSSAHQRLHALVLHHLHVLLDEGNDFIAVMVTEQRALLPEHRMAIREVRDRYEQAWRDVLAELENQAQLHAPASVTRLALFGSLHGTLNWYHAGQRLSLPELAGHLLAIFVKPPEAASDAALTCATSSTLRRPARP